MNRREAVSGLGAGIMGVIGLPSWAKAWSPKTLPKDSLGLNITQTDLLDHIAETFIPETDTPGSKSLEIAKFIKLMITDMHKKADHERFKKSLDSVNQIASLMYGKAFEQCSIDQKLHLLKGLELGSDSDQNWFFNTTKRYAVQAYTSSEYYMTNVAKFEFAPARYLGCVPLNS